MKKSLRIFLAVAAMLALSAIGYAAEEMTWEWNKTDTSDFNVSGFMTVDGGTMHNDWEHSKSRAVLSGYAWNSASVELSLQNGGVNESSEVWVIVNMQDENNYYYVSFGGGTQSHPSVWKKENGNYEKLTQSDNSFDLFNNPKDIAVKSENGRISAYFGEDLIVCAEDSTFLSGSIGLETWNSVLYMKGMTVNGSFEKVNKWVWDGSGSGWSFSGNMKAKGGTISNDWDNKNASAVYSGVLWSDYTYEISVQNEGGGDSNKIEIWFAYKNSMNYYSISIGGCYIPDGETAPTENSVSLYKITDGNKEEIARYDGTFRITSNPGTLKIQSDNGVFSISGIDGERNSKVLFENIDGADSTSGMIGFCTLSSVGYFRGISVKGDEKDIRLLGECINIIPGEENVDVNIEPTVQFNMGIDKATAYKSSITVETEKGVLPQDNYTLSVDPLGELKIMFVNPLERKTKYKITIGTEICSLDYGFGMQEPLVIEFKTKPADIDIASADSFSETGEKVNIASSTGKTINVRVTVKCSNEDVAGEYILCTVLCDENGTVLKKAATLGDFKADMQNDIVHTFKVEKESCHAEVYLWDSLLKMHTLYPFVQIN